MYPFLLVITGKSGNTENIQKTIPMFDWQKTFKNKNTNEKTRILTDTLMNIFKFFILHKTKKNDCKFIIYSLKKRTKYTKRFYKNPSDCNKDLLNKKENKCTKLIIQANKKHIAKMSPKLVNPGTASKNIGRFRHK